MDPYFNGTISNGQVKLNNKEQFYDYIRNFEGKVIQVLVRKYKTSRTIKQNDYYWGCVVQKLANKLGYTKEEMHAIYGQLFLIIERNGMKFVRSTTSLTSDEMSKYIKQIQQWASEVHNFYIPDSDEIEV